MSKPNIVLIGHVCVDHNKSEHAAYTAWGSSTLYMATSFKKQFEANSIVVANWGSDLVTYLPDVTMYPSVPNQPKTLVYENDTSTGKRTQRCHNLPFATPPTLTSEIKHIVRNADIVVVATLLPNYPASYLQEVLDYVKDDALTVLCPQGYFRHITEDGRVEPREFIEASTIAPLFDLVIYSEEDSPQAYGLAHTLKQSTKTEIIVTQGANGATIIDKKTDMHIPTKPIPLEQIVDSVGCGDTFAAAVTYSYYQSRDLPAAILDGHHAAGKKLLTQPE
jgi:sugar/nucleoside kinase (ribokinase family)